MCVCVYVSGSSYVFLRLSFHFESYFKRRRSTKEKSTRCATKLRILPHLPTGSAIRIVTGAQPRRSSEGGQTAAVSPSHFTVSVSEVVGAPCYSPPKKKSQAVVGMFYLMLQLQYTISFSGEGKRITSQSLLRPADSNALRTSCQLCASPFKSWSPACCKQ